MEPDRTRAACKVPLQEGPQFTNARAPPRGAKRSRLGLSSQGEDDDQLDLFARFVAAELRQLPKRKATVLQQEITARIVHCKKRCLDSIESDKVEQTIE